MDARVRKLRRKIDDYVQRHRLDSRVSGIMQNMHPGDVVKVMEVPFPEDCRNPSGFVVSQIRRTERDAGRPKDYRWNGKTWDQGPKDFGARDRTPERNGGRDGGRDGRRDDRRDERRDRRRGRSRDRLPRAGRRAERGERGERRRRNRSASDSRSESRSDSRSASRSSRSASQSASKLRKKRR